LAAGNGGIAEVSAFKAFHYGKDGEYNFGLILPEDQTAAQAESMKEISDNLPAFSQFSFGAGELPGKAVLTEIQAAAISAMAKWIPENWLFSTTINGKPVKLFKNIQQNSGSCVGTSATKTCLDQSLYEAFFLNDKDRIVFPNTLYHYANGRTASGIRQPGDGSMGPGQVKAMMDDGFVLYDAVGLPVMQVGEEIELTKADELRYSIRSRIPQELFAQGQAHKLGSAVIVDSLEAGKKVIASGRPLYFCSDWGYTEGDLTAPTVSGLRFVRRRGATWHHCWRVDGYWMSHPELGNIWHLDNNWGGAHGFDPTTGTSFGFWVTEDTVDYILRGRQAYAFLDLEGFEDQLRKRSAFFDFRY
jgi:hypothetical protein